MSEPAPFNPFTNRAAIADPACFFGRRRELEAVLGRVLAGSKLQSLSLVGQRRIGKSSLFRALERLIPERDPEAVAVYFDLEASRRLGAGAFFATLKRKLARAAGIAAEPAAGDEGAWDSLLDFLEARKERVRPVFLLDEFDTVTSNPAFDADFFGSLRYLANNFDLAFVTSSYEDLSELCHAEEVRQSPFFNVFTALDLGLMPEGERDEMLVALARKAVPALEPAELDLVRELGGRYPFFVQIAGSAAWEMRRDGERGDAGALEARFRREADGHFRYFDAHLAAADRAALAALGRGEALAPAAAERLRRRSLVEVGPAGARPFSPAFATWLAEQAVAGPAGPGGAAPGASARSTSPAAASETVATPHAPGTAVAGRYTIESELGTGSYGAVFVARDAVLGRRVALKVLRPDSGHDVGERRARFVREAQALARMKHPNVVTVFDLGEWQGSPFIAMELVAGGTLADRLARRRRLPAGESARIAREAALGLGHAHSLGIVHRDVKPANLMLEADGTVRVGDFGIGRMSDPLLGGDDRITGEGRVIGTPAYLAPELLRGEPATPRSDLYSLGVVLFECLTGRRPFEAASVASVVARILCEDPPDPRVEVARLPAELAGIVQRAMARDPARRFASGEELARALAPLAG